MKQLLLKDKVYNDLLNAIFSLQYVAGEKLPDENELSKKFGVSRCSLRPALDKLEKQQLIERIKGKGTFISKNIKKDKITFLLPYAGSLTQIPALMENFQGVVEEASKFNCEVETIAVSPTNENDNIDFSKLFNLNSSSKVILNSFWFENVIPYLTQKKCQQFFICAIDGLQLHKDVDISLCNKLYCRSDHSARIVTEEILKRGVKNILFVMQNTATVAHFQYQTVAKVCEEYEKNISIEKVVIEKYDIDEIKKTLDNKDFDGMILKNLRTPYNIFLNNYPDKTIGLLDIDKHKIALNKRNFFYTSYDNIEIGREAVRTLMGNECNTSKDFYPELSCDCGDFEEIVSSYE